jgi:hypothetical protein
MGYQLAEALGSPREGPAPLLFLAASLALASWGHSQPPSLGVALSRLRPSAHRKRSRHTRGIASCHISSATSRKRSSRSTFFRFGKKSLVIHVCRLALHGLPINLPIRVINYCKVLIHLFARVTLASSYTVRLKERSSIFLKSLWCSNSTPLVDASWCDDYVYRELDTTAAQSACL